MLRRRVFFCYPTCVKRRALVWYQSIDPEVNADINSKNTPGLMCDNLVKTKIYGWISKKLQLRGVEFFMIFSVLKYVVIIEKLRQRSR
jgi:hypothetical protein